MGVHEPWIGEIAPSQYAGLSEREKRRYDEKRSREWDASAEAKREYRRKVVEAYERGEFNEYDSDIHPDAKSAIYYYKEEREKQAKAIAEKSANAKHEAKVLTSAQSMKKSEFAKWYVANDPNLHEGFEHVSRSHANIYWRAVHGEFQSIPHYVSQRIADAKWELKRENETHAS